MSYLIDTGRIYHTDGIGSSPIYGRVLTSSASDLIMCAHDVEQQMLFELSAYEPFISREVNDPRAEKYARLDKIYGWWGAYARSCKQYHGYRARGPQMDKIVWADGHVSTDYQPNQWSYTCWKDNYRPYQAHGRIFGEAS